MKTEIIDLKPDLYTVNLDIIDEDLRDTIPNAPATSIVGGEAVRTKDDGIVGALKALVGSTEDILIIDFGCEVGSIGHSLRSNGFEGELWGVDIHEHTLGLCAENGEYDCLYLDDASDPKCLEKIRRSQHKLVVATSYDIIEHLPIERVQSHLDVMQQFDLYFLSTPATKFAMLTDGNPYDSHIRCYDPVEQMRDWHPIDFWMCTSGGRLVTVGSRFEEPAIAELEPTPLRFRGSFSRNDVYKRLREFGFLPGKDYKRSMRKIKESLQRGGIDV